MTQPVGNYVRLTRVIRASREKVYNAWLDPEVRRQWWRATEDMTCEIHALDATVGGPYRIQMNNGDKVNTCYGRFIELDPPNRLVFTWNWEHAPISGGDSRVTIELFEAEFDGKPATELVLLHEKLDTPLERSDHTTGWLGCLKSLGGLFARQAEAEKAAAAAAKA